MPTLILSVFLCSNVSNNAVLMKPHKARYLEKIMIMLRFSAALVWSRSMKQNGNISLREWFSHAYWWMIIIILLILHCAMPPSGMLFFYFLISAVWLETAQGFVFVRRLSFDGFVLSWHSVRLQCKNKCELFLSGGKKGSFVVLNTYLILQKTQDRSVYLQIFSWEKV